MDIQRQTDRQTVGQIKETTRGIRDATVTYFSEISHMRLVYYVRNGSHINQYSYNYHKY